MRKLRIACMLLLIGMVAVLPFHQQVKSATANQNANHDQMGNPVPFEDRFAKDRTVGAKNRNDDYGWGQQVMGPIHITEPSAAVSAVPAVRLVFDTSYIGAPRDPRWTWRNNEASIKTEWGELKYTMYVPLTIDPGGSKCTISAQAIANKGSRLEAHVQVRGEIYWSDPSELFVTAEPGESKSQSLTVILTPRAGYSEGEQPVVALRMDMGLDNRSLDFRYRYNVER
jgi:hypothetical protein